MIIDFTDNCNYMLFI